MLFKSCLNIHCDIFFPKQRKTLQLKVFSFLFSFVFLCFLFLFFFLGRSILSNVSALQTLTDLGPAVTQN